ncbi:MAG: hypothetical protein ACRD3E_16510 [Terriglobales bacterium]
MLKPWSVITLLLLFVSGAAFAQSPPYPQTGYSQNSTSQQNPGYANDNYIPDGTRFMVQLNDKLDTRKLKQGKKFQAKLSEDLTAPNGTVIPAGKKVKGHVSSVDRGLHARLLLSFDEIETNHGWRPLIATVTGVPGEHAVNQETGPEGEIQRRGVDKTRVLEGAAVGAAVGAAAGAATAGPHGAIIGAAAGGALGGGAGLLTERDLTLNKGTELEVRLDRPLQVPR